MILVTKKCRIYAACGVSQTPINSNDYEVTTSNILTNPTNEYMHLFIITLNEYNNSQTYQRDGKSKTLKAQVGLVYGSGIYKIPYGVIFNTNGHGTNPSAVEYTQCGSASLPTLPDESTYIFDGWYTASSGGSKVTSLSSYANSTTVGNTTLYAHWVQHSHNWKYVAGTGNDANKVFAYCTGTTNPSACQYHGSGRVAASPYLTLTVAEDKTYDGTVIGDASVVPSDKWSVTGQAVPTISYDKETRKDADTYTASITVGTATVSKNFSITKREVSVTAPTVASLTYTGNEEALLSANGSINNAVADDDMKLEYRLAKVNEDDTETELVAWSESAPKASEVGTYKVYYRIKNADSYSNNYTIADTDQDGSKFVTVSMEKGVAVVSTVPEAKDITYNGTSQTLITGGESSTGTIKYRLGTSGEWSDTLPAGKNATDYDVYYKVFGDSNHKDSEAIKIENTKINKKVIDSLTWTNDSFTYDGQSHKPTANVDSDDVCAGDSLTVSVGDAQTDTNTYTATATGLTGTGAENYVLTTENNVIQHSFTINPAIVTIEWSNTEFTYNGNTQQPTATVNGVLSGGTCTVTVTGGKVDANTETTPTYTAKVATDALSNHNYKLETDATTTFVINPKVVSLDWNNAAFTYTGTEQTIEANVGNKAKDSDSITLTYENNKATAVGTYTAVVTGLGNPNYTLTGAENISKEWKISYLTAEAVVSGTKKIADGDWYTSAVVVEPKEAGYQISADGITWEDQISVNSDGDHTVTFYLKQTSTGYITDQMQESFKIDTTAPTGTITIKNNDVTRFFNTITAGFFFKKTVDVTIAAEDPKAEGVDAVSDIAKVEYQKTAKGASYTDDGWVTGKSFSVEANEKFDVYARITDKAGNETIIDSKGNVVYQDAVATDEFTFTKTSTEDHTTMIDVGVNTVKSISIQKDTVSAGVAGEMDAQAVPADAYDVVANKIVLKKDYLNTLAAGDYIITVNYNPYGETFTSGQDAAPSTITVHVVKAAGTVKITNDISKTYDKTAVSAPTFTKGSTENAVIEYKVDGADDSTYTTTAPVNAGKYMVRVIAPADDNYKAAKDEKKFTIEKAQATITVLEDNKSYTKTYGAEDFTLVGIDKDGESPITYTSENPEVVTVDKDGKVTIKGAGQATITLAMAESENYKKTSETVTVTVGKKEVTVTPKAAEKFYTEADPAFDYETVGLVNGDKLNDIVVSRVAGEDVGTYEMSAKENADTNPNYQVKFNTSTFTIKTKEVTLSAKDIKITGDGSFVYDGNEKKPAVVVMDGDKVIPASEYTVDYRNNVNASKDTTEAANKPTVIITDKADGNYTVGGSKTFEIAKADPELSVSAVADQTFGGTDFTLDVHRTGESAPTFTSNKESVLTVDSNGKVTLKGAGTATVTVAMAESTNFNAKSVMVDITVNQKDATLVVDKMVYEVTYGDADFTIDGIRSEGESPVKFTNSNDAVATVDQAGKVSIKKVGETTITLTMAASANYKAVTTTVTVKVAPKAITVKADDKSLVYGDTQQALTYSATGLVGNDKLTDITISRTGGNNAGTYDITVEQETGANSNYAITFEKGSYKIDKKLIELLSVEINGEGTPIGADFSGLVNREKLIAGTDYVLNTTISADKKTASGTVELKNSATASNYRLSETPYVFTSVPVRGEIRIEEPVKVGKVPDMQTTVPEGLKEKVIEELLTPKQKEAFENGADFNIFTQVSELPNVPAKDETEIKNIAGDSTLVFADISLLFQQVGVDTTTKIKDTGDNPVSITLSLKDFLPAVPDGYTRTEVKVLAYHDVDPTAIDVGGTYDPATGTYSFTTTKFSTYAVAYKDTKNTTGDGDNSDDDGTNPNPNPGNDNNKPNPGKDTSTNKPDSVQPVDNNPTNSDNKKTTAPKTGDTFDPKLWLFLMGFAAFGMFGATRLRKKDEEQN